jgi:predicted nucleotide-binding protein (sugar kinase/HSP70/actin superfamily)
MKVSFFHLGAIYAYIEPYLRSLGLDVVVPPFSSRRTLDLGTRFCPEVCILRSSSQNTAGWSHGPPRN